MEIGDHSIHKPEGMSRPDEKIGMTREGLDHRHAVLDAALAGSSFESSHGGGPHRDHVPALHAYLANSLRGRWRKITPLCMDLVFDRIRFGYRHECIQSHMQCNFCETNAFFL